MFLQITFHPAKNIKQAVNMGWNIEDYNFKPRSHVADLEIINACIQPNIDSELGACRI